MASTNISNLHYWHPEIQENTGPNNFSNATLITTSDAAKKIFRRPMLLVNNISKPELFAHPFEKQYADQMTFINEKMDTKHFLAPLSSFQITQSAGCGEETPKNNTPVAMEMQTEIETPMEAKPTSLNICITQPTLQIHSSPAPKLRPYSCQECGKTFLLKHHLTTHEKTHTGERPHACIHCGKCFTHKHCLNTHLLLHSSDRPYQCTECKKSFTLKHHLLTHARVHNREKPFTCEECGRSFPLKRHLVTHSKFHAGERPFICEECGESFAQKDHLVMHSRFHGSLNSFACNECGARFTRKFELVNHGRLHGKVPFTCPICNKEFMQKRTLVVHMSDCIVQYHTENPTKPITQRYHTGESVYTCLVCGESFQTKNELSAHSKNHTNAVNNSNNSEKYSCQECGSSFNNPEALALHIKLHTGDTSLVNDLCALTASLQSSNFPISLNGISTTITFNANPQTQTIQQVVTHNKSKSHICQHCSKAFSAKHGLHQHNKRHPEGTCALKSHVCPTCNKAFYQKNHLLLHQRQHMDFSGKNGSSDSKPEKSGSIESPVTINYDAPPMDGCRLSYGEGSPNNKLEVIHNNDSERCIDPGTEFSNRRDTLCTNMNQNL